MTHIDEGIEVLRKLVVFTDLCSSTSLLEDLLRSENQKLWRDLLIRLKDYLRIRRLQYHFDIYKFIGDGWILLFPETAEPLRLMEFLGSLHKKYEALYKQLVEPVLSVDVPIIGITFGIDKGTLIRSVMNNQVEYIGRPLNVAARLQTAIKDKDPHPQGKVMISNNAYASMKDELSQRYRVMNVTRDLRNIAAGGGYKAKKLVLIENH